MLKNKQSANINLKQKKSHKWLKTKHLRDFLSGRGFKDLTVCCGFALHTYRSATEILTNFSTRLALCAKNSSPNCFLNAQTLTGSSPFYL